MLVGHRNSLLKCCRVLLTVTHSHKMCSIVSIDLLDIDDRFDPQLCRVCIDGILRVYDLSKILLVVRGPL